jgi:hypothetical protein
LKVHNKNATHNYSYVRAMDVVCLLIQMALIASYSSIQKSPNRMLNVVDVLVLVVLVVR